VCDFFAATVASRLSKKDYAFNMGISSTTLQRLIDPEGLELTSIPEAQDLKAKIDMRGSAMVARGVCFLSKHG